MLQDLLKSVTEAKSIDKLPNTIINWDRFLSDDELQKDLGFELVTAFAILDWDEKKIMKNVKAVLRNISQGSTDSLEVMRAHKQRQLKR